MYNIDLPLQIHNKYEYKLIDNNTGEIVKTNTVYNTAIPGLFVMEVGASNTNGASVTFEYTHDNINSYYQTSLTFYRTTPAESVDFNTNIAYSGTTEITSHNVVGNINKIGLGRYVQDSNVYYWSEINESITMNENNSLVITITLYFNVSVPSSGAIKYYDINLTSLLSKTSNSFPSPGVRSIAVSPLPFNSLPNILNKKIPTFMTLPTRGVGRDFAYITENLSNVEDISHEGELYLPSFGLIKEVSGYRKDSNFNCGIMRSVLLTDVGLANFGSSGSIRTIIPAAKLYRNTIDTLLEQNLDRYYFYCAVPIGSPYGTDDVKITLNNEELQNAGATFVDPRAVNMISITGVAMSSEDTPTSINSFRNTNVGTYYANYLFENDGYWEPPSGSSICPNYIYFGSAPTNVVTGNITCIIQGKRNNSDTWENISNIDTYSTITLDYDSSEYSEYRMYVNGKSCSNTNFYLNNAEQAIIPLKSYDPMILRVGAGSDDFTTTGICIPRATLENWKNALIADQKTLAYTLGIEVTISGMMYKTANTIAYMKYKVEATGH